MKRYGLIVIFVMCVCSSLVGLTWSALGSTPVFRSVMLGSTKSNDFIKISGGNLFVVAPHPGLFFGTVQQTGQPEEFTYLIEFRYGLTALPESKVSVRSHCESEGRVTETRNSLECNGKRVEAVYRVTTNESRTTIESESLIVGGKTVDVSKGRVFTIDLSASQPEYCQQKIELPTIHQGLQTTEDVERIAGTVSSLLPAATRR